jgi:hypothetical protein
MYLKGGGKFSMKATFRADGWMDVYMDGEEIKINNPTPSDSARAVVAKTMVSRGVQFHSSQWVGWVPGGNCPGGGGLDSSVFAVSNVKISGTVVNGVTPTKC